MTSATMAGMKRRSVQMIVVVLTLAVILWRLVRTLDTHCRSDCDVIFAGFLMQVGIVMLVAITAWVLTLQMKSE